METVNAKQVMSNLYGLMMEINFYYNEDELLTEIQASPDAQIERHLLRVRQLNAKMKAEANKLRFKNAIEKFALIKQKGLDEFKKLIQPQDQARLIPLFRKFEELTPEDEAAIHEDQELLYFMEFLKHHMNEDSN